MKTAKADVHSSHQNPTAATDPSGPTGRLALGDKVCALLAGGGYAQYVAVPAVQCLPAPARLTLEEAAALPEAFFTVWLNVFERSRAKVRRH